MITVIKKKISSIKSLLINRDSTTSFQQNEQFNSSSAAFEGCLYFIHMGKTGGGTVVKWLHSIVDSDKCFQGQFDGVDRLTGMATVSASFNALSLLDKKQRKSLKLVMGHLPLELMNFLPKPVKCVTVLREPIDRELSSLFYLKTIDGQRGDYFRKLSISDYARSSAIADNYQVRILSGLEELNPVWIEDVKYETINGRLDLLELAKKNIEKYFYTVGFVENLDHFINVLSKIFCQNPPENLPKENVTPSRIAKNMITPKELELLWSKVDLDSALYEWARSKYIHQTPSRA